MAKPKAIPTPDNDTVCGLPEALSLIDSIAFLRPVAPGVKLTLIAQVAFAARLAPQLLFCVKSLELIVMLLIVNEALPTFDNDMA